MCANCDCQMRIIAFITHSTEKQPILSHIGVDLKRHTCCRHAGRRCGITAMRRRVRAARSDQIGIWQHNRHQTIRLISESTGRGVETVVSLTLLADFVHHSLNAALGQAHDPRSLASAKTAPPIAFGTPKQVTYFKSCG